MVSDGDLRQKIAMSFYLLIETLCAKMARVDACQSVPKLENVWEFVLNAYANCYLFAVQKIITKVFAGEWVYVKVNPRTPVKSNMSK